MEELVPLTVPVILVAVQLDILELIVKLPPVQQTLVKMEGPVQ